MSVALCSSLLQYSFVATRSPATSGHQLIQFVQLTRMMTMGSALPANPFVILLRRKPKYDEFCLRSRLVASRCGLRCFIGQKCRIANLSSELPYAELSHASRISRIPISAALIILGIFPYSSSRVERTGCFTRPVPSRSFVAWDRSCE